MWDGQAASININGVHTPFIRFTYKGVFPREMFRHMHKEAYRDVNAGLFIIGETGNILNVSR